MITTRMREACGLSDSTTPGPPSATLSRSDGIVVEQGALLNFASSDYLGLATHPEVVGAACEALRTSGLGSGSARGLAGTTVEHERLEQTIARWVGCERAVLFQSCWSANAALFQVLADLARTTDSTLEVFSARDNHASIIDALRAQRGAVSALHLFDHRSAEGITMLEQLLSRREPDAEAVVVVDGVFSMEGDRAPVAELVRLCHMHRALLVVDDSHGTGVIGQEGRGTAEAEGVWGRVDVVTGTLGKALGGSIGGFIAASDAVAGAVRRRARPYTFSNNPPPSVLAGVRAALGVIQADTTLRPRLDASAARLRAGLADLGLATTVTSHPIVPVLIGDEARAIELSASLRGAGVFARAIGFPMVPRGAARVRLQVNATHSHDDIDQVLVALSRHCGGTHG